MGKTNPPRAPINWLILLVAGVCLLFGLVGIYWTVVPPHHTWGMSFKWTAAVLLVLSTCYLILLELSPLICKRKCASCGTVVYHHVPSCDPCPHCDRPFEDVTNLMPQQGALRIREYLSASRPTARLIGMILAMAIRDGVNEIRFVGRDDIDDPDAPPDAPDHSWRIWLHQKGEAYEMVPPPPHVGTDVFRVFKEIHRRVQSETADGPACFRIAIDDYSEPVELVLQESEEEHVAKIVFTSETLEPWAGGERFLNDYFESRCPGETMCGNADCA